MENQEIFKEIKNYEGLYSASNLGNIKGLKCNRVLKGIINKYGYLRVTLSKNNIRINYSIHRLVAETFIPNPENKATVNHLFGIKTDNRVTEIEWATNLENMQHANRTGLMNHVGSKGEKQGNAKLKNEQVLLIREKYSTSKTSHRKLAKEFNIDHRVVGKIVNNQLWKHI